MPRAKQAEQATEVGDTVKYVTLAGEIRPAIVTSVDGESGIVHLTVFFTRGDGYGAENATIAMDDIERSDDKAPGTWYA